MPRIHIEFYLPEEKDEYEAYFYSSDMHGALLEIHNYLRNIEKGYFEDSEEMYNEKLFKSLRDIIEDSGIWKMN